MICDEDCFNCKFEDCIFDVSNLCNLRRYDKIEAYYSSAYQKINERRRQYYQENKDKIAEYRRQYYLKTRQIKKEKKHDM